MCVFTVHREKNVQSIYLVYGVRYANATNDANERRVAYHHAIAITTHIDAIAPNHFDYISIHVQTNQVRYTLLSDIEFDNMKTHLDVAQVVECIL